jgi:type II secretory pathway pseudopilin PulG
LLPHIKTLMEAESREPVNNQPEEKNRENRLLIIIIFILALLLVLLGWQYWKQKQSILVQVQASNASRDSVRSDLIKLGAEYSGLKTSNQKIQDELNGKKDTIAVLLQQAEKYKDDPYIIARLKKETETLRKIMQDYVRTIDSLNTANKQLTAERNMAIDSLNNEKNHSGQLEKQNSQLQTVVHTGSMLAATSITTEGVFYRFGKKEVVTDKAKKAEKIKIDFTITANRIAKSGNKDIYVRILTPDGKELSKTGDASSIFKFEGTKGYYDAKQTIDYANTDLSLVIYCESTVGFLPGNYIIKLYSDGSEMGETNLTLK